MLKLKQRPCPHWLRSPYSKCRARSPARLNNCAAQHPSHPAPSPNLGGASHAAAREGSSQAVDNGSARAPQPAHRADHLVDCRQAGGRQGHHVGPLSTTLEQCMRSMLQQHMAHGSHVHLHAAQAAPTDSGPTPSPHAPVA